ncbi:MAG: glycosyltransferase family 2 protein, partial [Dehalococcoidia bacterium]|nr:glycosyltransferase family 2 protein [Dehalococcoidia bacterium]
MTVVIPAYNAAGTIGRALDSVYAQTYENIIEVVVVDDGSTDNTADIVRQQFPDVTLIRQRNTGVSTARNVGATNARGDWLAFLDSDDEWLPDKLQVQVDFAVACPGVGLLMCEEITVPVGGSPQQKPEAAGLSQFTLRDWLRGRAVRQGVSLSCSGWLFRRAL